MLLQLKLNTEVLMIQSNHRKSASRCNVTSTSTSLYSLIKNVGTSWLSRYHGCVLHIVTIKFNGHWQYNLILAQQQWISTENCSHKSCQHFIDTVTVSKPCTVSCCQGVTSQKSYANQWNSNKRNWQSKKSTFKEIDQ